MAGKPVFHYSGDPAASPEAETRFWLQDTDEDDPFLSEAEIKFLLNSEGGNAKRAAARGAERLAAKFTRDVDETAGRVSVAAGSLSEKFQKLADRLWAEIGDAVSPYVGGLSHSEIDAKRMDEDKVQPAFRRDLHDHPGTDISNGDERDRF